MSVRRSIYSLISIMAAVGQGTRAPAAERPGIAIVQTSEVLGADTLHDGAAEFGMLYTIARQQREHRTVGIVGIGNRHGLFPLPGEQSLQYFATRGMVVAKLARGSDFVPDPDGLFVDCGNLRSEEAAALLSQCLVRFGPPPAIRNAVATTGELEAIRGHLSRFRQAFLFAQHGAAFAVR